MIKIICIGKVKESYFKEAIQEYLKRLTKYTKIELLEGPDFGKDTKEQNLKLEKEFILKHIQEKDYVITLEIDGTEQDSIAFSELIEKTTMNYSNLTFIIGGSDGLDEEVKQRSNYALSFSKLTFPHTLFRVLLLEQLYRAYKIKNHETYHK